MIGAVVPSVAGRCRFLPPGFLGAESAWWPALTPTAMLRIHGDRNSLLAALTAHWADQQLQIPQPLRPLVGPITRRPGSKR